MYMLYVRILLINNLDVAGQRKTIVRKAAQFITTIVFFCFFVPVTLANVAHTLNSITLGGGVLSLPADEQVTLAKSLEESCSDSAISYEEQPRLFTCCL